jgi:FimV-like protein
MTQVLLVDDDAALLELFQEELPRHGLEVRTARSGDEALRRIEADAPDVVVTDIHMRGMSGVELAKRAIELRPDVPIYEADPLVRRAASLQLTADARAPSVCVPSALWAQLGLHDGDVVRVSQGLAAADLPVRLDATLALAEQFLEIGEKEGARALLEEVIAGGSEALRQRATRLLVKAR